MFKKIDGCNLMKVSSTTNCPQGGDAGHGGVTTFSLEDLGGTCWDIKIKSSEKEFVFPQPEKITIELRGDSECHTFIEALEFASQDLLEQVNRPDNIRYYNWTLLDLSSNELKIVPLIDDNGYQPNGFKIFNWELIKKIKHEHEFLDLKRRKA